jgi:protein-S-isoprenylcysteine O-methyltransferase Ste14
VDVTAWEITFFDRFQVVALALFLVTFAGRTLHLRIHQHINPITLNTRKNGLLGVMELALFIEVNLWAIAVLLRALPLGVRTLPWLFAVQLLDSLPLKIVGVILIACAFVIHLLGLIALGNSWRLGIDEQQPGKLVTKGIYAVCRNPIYIFFDLYFIGTFLINGSLIFLVCAIFTITNLHYQILREEDFLARIHGPAYEAYRARTARYLTLRSTASPRRVASAVCEREATGPVADSGGSSEESGHQPDGHCP